MLIKAAGVRLSLFLFSMFLLCAAATPLAARTMYLSPTGNDSSPCAPGAEFLTLPAALGCLSAGDTLIVRNGIYFGGLIVQLEGTPEAPILIRGESLEAIIDTSRNGLDALRLDHSSYVTLDRLTFRHATRAGIGIINCDHITVTNCRCADNGKWGILTGFAYAVHFEGNECYGSKDEHGIYHSNSGDRFVIRGNILHDNAANGLHLNGDPELVAPGSDGVLDYGIVERNIIYGNGQRGGAGINMTHVHDVLVRNNLIYNNYAGGFTVYQDNGTFEQGSKRVVIFGNTVYFRQNDRNVVNVAQTSEKVVVANNILVATANHAVLQIDSDYLSTIVSDHNLFWGTGTAQAVERKGRATTFDSWRNGGNDRHTVFADPLFANIDSLNFRPADTSKAIDAGMPVDSLKAILTGLGGFEWTLAQLDSLPYEDILKNHRPAGAAPDIGAYESGAEPEKLYDFNGDGRFNLIDALALILQSRRDPQNKRLDIDGDGSYSASDVLRLLLILIGIA